MKKLLCTLTLGAGLLLGLSGCDLYQPDVDSLLTPPVLSELQTEVDEALRDVVGQELRLCYPAGGSYRSPYIFTDLDGDEEQEAVVFYTVEDEPLVYLQILDKSDGRWRARNALPGTEGEVLFVDFRHLSGDGATDLLVGWREPDREFDTLYLYRYRDAALSEEFHISCDGMAIADFDGDGYEELIAATVDGGVTLQYIGWSGVGISVLDSAYSSLRLQNILESVTGLIAQELPGTVFSGRINADMTASLLVGVQNGRLVLPQEEAPTGYADGYCYSGASPADINGDGIVELPWSAVVPGSAGSSREETRYFTEYRTLQYGSYSTVAACYQNTTDGWRFILPPALYDQYWMDALTLSRRAETREVIFRRYTGSLNETGEEYLRLRVVSAAEGTEPEGYTLLATRGQFAYYAFLPAGSPISMTQVEEGFSLLG